MAKETLTGAAEEATRKKGKASVDMSKPFALVLRQAGARTVMEPHYGKDAEEANEKAEVAAQALAVHHGGKVIVCKPVSAYTKPDAPAAKPVELF